MMMISSNFPFGWVPCFLVTLEGQWSPHQKARALRRVADELSTLLPVPGEFGREERNNVLGSVHMFETWSNHSYHVKMYFFPVFAECHTIDGCNTALIGSLAHHLQGFIHPIGCCLGFLNHQQYYSNEIPINSTWTLKLIDSSIATIPETNTSPLRIGGWPNRNLQNSKGQVVELPDPPWKLMAWEMMIGSPFILGPILAQFSGAKMLDSFREAKKKIHGDVPFFQVAPAVGMPEVVRGTLRQVGVRCCTFRGNLRMGFSDSQDGFPWHGMNFFVYSPAMNGWFFNGKLVGKDTS